LALFIQQLLVGLFHSKTVSGIVYGAELTMPTEMVAEVANQDPSVLRFIFYWRRKQK
jgi:hypothetical protein